MNKTERKGTRNDDRMVISVLLEKISMFAWKMSIFGNHSQLTCMCVHLFCIISHYIIVNSTHFPLNTQSYCNN